MKDAILLHHKSKDDSTIIQTETDEVVRPKFVGESSIGMGSCHIGIDKVLHVP